MAVLIFEPHVQPARTVLDPLFGLGPAHDIQQGGFDQAGEIGLGQARQLAVGSHAHGRIATCAGNQCLFAKGVAGAELREADFALVTALTHHLASAALHRVVVVTRLALPDDFIAGRDVHRLEGIEQALDIGGRDAREKLRLEQGHEPVAGLLGLHLHFLDLDPARDVVGGRGLAVHAEQLFEQTASHPQHAGLGFCDGRHLSRLKLGQGLKGSALAAANALDEGPVRQHLKVALEHIEGEVVAVALLEQRVFLA